MDAIKIKQQIANGYIEIDSYNQEIYPDLHLITINDTSTYESASINMTTKELKQFVTNIIENL